MSGKFLVNSDGSWAVCNGRFLTLSEDNGCACGPPTTPRYARFCPCEQEGCHPDHPLIWVREDTDLAFLCQFGFKLGNWCWHRTTDYVFCLEDIPTTESHLVVDDTSVPPFDQGFTCLSAETCFDEACLPPENTCECGQTPCNEVCSTVTYPATWTTPPGASGPELVFDFDSPVHCCMGARQGDATHDINAYNYSRTDVVTLMDGASPGCGVEYCTGGAPCMFREYHDTTVGEVDRNFCNIDKLMQRCWTVWRPFINNGHHCCAPETPPCDEPRVVSFGIPSHGIYSYDTGWITTSESENECGVLSFNRYRIRETSDCFFHQNITEYSERRVDNACPVRCTVEVYEIVIQEVTVIPGPDPDNCCHACRCESLDLDCSEEATGGFCPPAPTSHCSEVGAGDFL